ncbi:Gfo/Idh/MocA family protein [Nocardia sp. NPDC052566]|uniref:Gfo/Idh/MocA family protein n=1 Tax=Nocardia sp. NPDC052566 TaxID=3364330 RepID=UPI0037CA04A7
MTAVIRPRGGDTPRLGIALVGLGRAGRQHLAAATRLDTCRMHAAVDTDPAVAADSPIPVTALEESLGDPAVHMVSICLPPGAAEAVALRAFEAGKHVLLEKPPAATGAQLDRLLQAADRADRLAAVMFQHRFALPEQLRSDAPRRFEGAKATLLVSRPRSAEHYGGTGWRSAPALAWGGVTAHLGVHYLDLAGQLLGEPASVERLARAEVAPGIDVEQSAFVRFRNGSQLTVIVTTNATARIERLTVLGRRDWVEISDGRISGQLDDDAVERDARPAQWLRTEVYRELADAALGIRPLELAALRRSGGVVTMLSGLLDGFVSHGRG